MLKRIWDWKTIIIQFLGPLLLAILVAAYGADKILLMASVKEDELTVLQRVILSFKKGGVFLALFLFFFWFVRKHNKEQILKQNLSVVVWHFYWGYWFCRYVMNYQTVSLTRVPIPVQFKLVWKGLFNSYVYDGIVEKQSERIHFKRFNDDIITTTINLVLADTYSIDWRAKLPETVLKFTTIEISRVGQPGVRIYNPDYVAKINEVIHLLPHNVTSVNVFATTNPAHVEHIVKEVFKTGGRDYIKSLRIFQQSEKTWIFEGKKYIDIKTGVK